MLWLYSFEVRYFERRRISELAPRDIAPNATAGVVVGFVLFSSVLAFLFLGGLVHHVQFAGGAGLTTQASASLAAAIGEELLFRRDFSYYRRVAWHDRAEASPAP